MTEKEKVLYEIQELSKHAKIDDSNCWYEPIDGELPKELVDVFNVACADNIHLKNFDFKGITYMSELGMDYMTMFLWINCEQEIKKHLNIENYNDFCSTISCRGMGSSYSDKECYCPITGLLLINVRLDNDDYIETLLAEITTKEDICIITPELAYFLIEEELITNEFIERLVHIIYQEND